MIIDLSDEHIVDTRLINSFPYKKENLPSRTGHDETLSSIFLALEGVVVRSRFPVVCDWKYLDSSAFREPCTTFKSLLHSGRSYDFIIRFPMGFPSSPPRILPIHSLPCLPFVVISNHPIFSKEYWSTTQSVSEIFETVLTYLESLSYDYSDSLKHETHAFLDNSSPDVYLPLIAERSIESMISDLYGMFRFEVKGYPELEEVVLRLYPPDFCKILGSTSSSSSSSSKKNVKKGTGYSTGGFGKSQRAISTVVSKSRSELVLDEIASKLKSFTAQKGWFKWLLSSSSSSSSSTMSQSLAGWILLSPLIDTLSFILSGFSREEMFRRSGEVGTIFSILYKIEQIATSFPKESEKPLDKSFSMAMRLENVRHLFSLAYKRLHTLVDDDIFSSRAAWIKEIQKSSQGYQQVVQSSKTISLDTEEQSSAQGSSSSSSSPPSTRKIAQRVYHFPNIEQKHYFYQQSGSSPVKCSKSWMRELSFIEENLPEEITLFVSEDHPNYFVCCMHVLNVDCPYYGGSYFFHILVPANYPSTSPKVQFMTTGEGTVRFNPNLYNCGKVCLSLLGTWAG
jgi:ubiquitin-protein ligase